MIFLQIFTYEFYKVIYYVLNKAFKKYIYGIKIWLTSIMSITNINISGNVISWSGPFDISYSVIGIGKDNEAYVYYTGLTTTSATIYSPSKDIFPSYIQSFIIEAVSETGPISASYLYYLGSLYYDLSNGGYSIKGIENTDQTYNIIIPSLFNELPVTSIGQSSFHNHANIENIFFEEPTMISSIPMNSFRGCTSLISVNLPASITSIGDNAFNGCISLQSISLPEKLQTIGELAFGFCTNLTAVMIPINVTSIGASSFTDCGITNLLFSQPSSVTTIGHNAFDICDISSVIIPASVTTIGNFAFTGASTIYFEGNVPTQGMDTNILAFGATGYFYSVYTGWASYVSSGFRGITMNSIESINSPIITTTSSSIINLSSIVINLSGVVGNFYSVFDNDIVCASGEILTENILSLTISNLSNLSHIFKAMVTNQVGVSSPYTYLRPIAVDTIQPIEPIISASKGSYSDSSSILLKIVGEASTTYSLFNNTSLLSSGTLNIFGKATKLLSGLSDQLYNFKVRITDSAGNTSSFSNILDIRVITSPPSVPTISPTPSQSSQTVTIYGEVGTRYFISLTGAADISGEMVSEGISYSFSNLFYTKLYTLSVTLKDPAGNSSSTSRTWRPPFILSMDGTNLSWNSENNANSGLAYNIYSVYSNGLKGYLGTRSYPPFSFMDFGGLSMALRVEDTSQNAIQLTNVSIPIDASFSGITGPYLTEALRTNTHSRVIKNMLTTYSTNMTLIGGNGVNLFDPSQQSVYSIYSLDMWSNTRSMYNDTFSITSCPLGSSPTISPSVFPLNSECILYSWTMSPFASSVFRYQPSLRPSKDSFTTVSTSFFIV